MSPTIEQIDTRSAPEENLAALHELHLQWDLERQPGHPEMPWLHRLADWRNVSSFEEVPRWVAFDGGRAIATSGVYLHTTQDLDNAWGWVYVHPDRRGHGLGRELVRPTVAYSEDRARERYGVGVPKGSQYGSIPVRAGMKAVYDERVSRLRTADLDHALMESWIEASVERAAGYELLFLPMPIPAEHRKRMIEVTEVMNTAPLEDLEEDPFHWDDELLRDVEERAALKGELIHTCVARERSTGDFVGFTTLVYQRLYPVVAQQWDTGVDPRHRNLGLGRWLKAAMILQFLGEHPEVEIVETENAESNAPMLNINVAMGFKPALEDIIYQGKTSAVAQWAGR